MDQQQAERLQQYQMNDALSQVREVVHGLGAQGIPVEVTTTTLMVTLVGTMAATAVYGGVSHEDAQKQLEDGFATMRNYMAKIYTEIADEKAKRDAEVAEQPGWMNPDNMPSNGTAQQ
jgi:hypothetical protein